MLSFDPFSLGLRRQETNGQILRQILSPNRKNCRVTDAPIQKNSQVRRPSPQIHHHHAEFTFLLAQHRFTGCQRLKDDVDHVKPSPIDTLHDILR
jgi:hypothetical protein